MQVLSNGRCKRTEAEWRQILGRFEASGQSGREFCRAEGIELSSFQRWRRRLEGSRAGCDFVTVRPGPEASGSWALEIVLPSIGTVRLQGRS